MRFLLPILLITSISCQNSTITQSEKQVSKIEPSELYKRAKLAADSSNFDSALAVLHNIINLHQDSSFTDSARTLIQIISRTIAVRDSIILEGAKEAAVKKAKDVNAALSKLRVKRDEFNSLAWYYDKSSPQYVNYNGFFIYINTNQSGVPDLYLRIQYAADDWLFIESTIVLVDGVRYHVSENEFDEWERDNGEGGIWEWFTMHLAPGSVEMDMVNAIIEATEVKYRLNGAQYYKDKTVSSAQKTAMRNVMEAYNLVTS